MEHEIENCRSCRSCETVDCYKKNNASGVDHIMFEFVRIITCETMTNKCELDEVCGKILSMYDELSNLINFSWGMECPDDLCWNLTKYVPNLWKLYIKHRKLIHYLVENTDKFKDHIPLEISFQFIDVDGPTDIINFDLFVSLKRNLMENLYIEPGIINIITRMVLTQK